MNNSVLTITLHIFDNVFPPVSGNICLQMHLTLIDSAGLPEESKLYMRFPIPLPHQQLILSVFSS
jgi:hypothetical protein